MPFLSERQEPLVNIEGFRRITLPGMDVDGIEADVSALENLMEEGFIDWDEFRLIIVRAVKHTGQKAFTAVNKFIRSRYNIKLKDLKRILKLRPPNFRNFMAVIMGRHRSMEFEQISLKYFGAKQLFAGRGKRTKKIKVGVKAAVKKVGGKKKWKIYPKGFMMPVDGEDRPMMRVGKGRWDIVSLTGPSPAQLLENSDVKAVAFKTFERHLPARLEHEFDALIGRQILGMLRKRMGTYQKAKK